MCGEKTDKNDARDSDSTRLQYGEAGHNVAVRHSLGTAHIYVKLICVYIDIFMYTAT